jgi:hypothetical protein
VSFVPASWAEKGALLVFNPYVGLDPKRLLPFFSATAPAWLHLVIFPPQAATGEQGDELRMYLQHFGFSSEIMIKIKDNCFRKS